jgi:heme-degrading monooxygenase HmoA
MAGARDASERVRAELTVTVAARDGQEFESAWSSVADWMRQRPGCLGQTLTRYRLGDPAPIDLTYVITSDWTTAEAFHAVERSEEQDRVTAPLRLLRRSARMTVQTIVEHVTPAGPARPEPTEQP